MFRRNRWIAVSGGRNWPLRTAAFIVDCLKNETTEKEIVDAMCRKYDAPREVLAADVKEILEKLRGINAIEWIN